MKTKKFETSVDVAEYAATNVIAVLGNAIKEKGTASWVLAGGTSPLAAYEILTSKYADSLDWGRVTVVIGDERLVPVDDPASNWGQIESVLFSTPQTASIVRLQPMMNLSAEAAAAAYSEALSQIPARAKGAPAFDLVWLGVGEDGHTLSLFPGHPDFVPSDDLVIAVHDSPKPPPTRITLTIHGVEGAANTVIFATGGGKKNAIAEALQYGELPIALVAAAIEGQGGEVTWLFDGAAWTDPSK
ncbi:MAG: 6-phosphogluconolactonase [Rhodoglobus sp.]